MRNKLVWLAKKLLRFSKNSVGFFWCDTQNICQEISKFESSEIHVVDRKPSQHRWCSGSIADFQAVDMGSIPVRCIISDDR